MCVCITGVMSCVELETGISQLWEWVDDVTRIFVVILTLQQKLYMKYTLIIPTNDYTALMVTHTEIMVVLVTAYILKKWKKNRK